MIRNRKHHKLISEIRKNLPKEWRPKKTVGKKEWTFQAWRHTSEVEAHRMAKVHYDLKQAHEKRNALKLKMGGQVSGHYHPFHVMRSDEFRKVLRPKIFTYQITATRLLVNPEDEDLMEKLKHTHKAIKRLIRSKQTLKNFKVPSPDDILE